MKMALSSIAAAAAVVLAGPTSAVERTFTATMSGPNEDPPVVSDGVGFAIVTLDTASFTMRVQAIFGALTGNVTVAHIHCCTATPGAGNVGVATPTPTFPDFPAGGTSGTYDRSFDMLAAGSWNATFVTNNGGTVHSAFSALRAGLESGSAYFNIHTTYSPPGEIRGFLQPTTPIPEPGTYALMVAGLGLVGWVARRRGTR